MFSHVIVTYILHIQPKISEMFPLPAPLVVKRAKWVHPLYSSYVDEWTTQFNQRVEYYGYTVAPGSLTNPRNAVRCKQRWTHCWRCTIEAHEIQERQLLNNSHTDGSLGCCWRTMITQQRACFVQYNPWLFLILDRHCILTLHHDDQKLYTPINRYFSSAPTDVKFLSLWVSNVRLYSE